LPHQTVSELSFPESDTEALRNLALAQGIMLDFMEGMVTTMFEDDEDMLDLFQAARAMQAGAEVYING